MTIWKIDYDYLEPDIQLSLFYKRGHKFFK